MKKTIAILATAACAATTAAALDLVQEWDKVFPLSDRVEHSKMTFRNRYGIELAADVYKPKGAEGRLAAVAVCGPFGAVKEQVSGLYAMRLAERGFLAVAFDPSYTGESGGEPGTSRAPTSTRRISSPPSTISRCAATWTRSGSASSASAVGAAWR